MAEYKDGPRKQMTKDWKVLVHKRLVENGNAGNEPSTVGNLAAKIGADKAGLLRTLDPEGTQTSSSYVDEICEMLDIDPPMIEYQAPDDELERELDKLRQLPPEKRDALLEFLRKWYG